MTKYKYDKATGEVIEKVEKQPDVIELLPEPNPPPDWFREIYEKYLDELRRGGPC